MNPHFIIYPSKRIMPKGWLLFQLQTEMERGLIAHFDTIDATVSQNLFAKNKRDHGYIPPYHKTKAAKDWWSGEHEGYWKDAFIRGAFYSGNQERINKAKMMVQGIIESAAEEGGYIGIYSKKSRYNQEKGPDNGELWTQSRILLALLTFYDFTEDKKIYDAVVKAMDITIGNYPKYDNYYNMGRGGGIAHGLMISDVAEELYNRTGDDKYAKFIQRIYDDFSKAMDGMPRYFDNQRERLLSKKKFTGHGVHTAEHLRVPFFLHSYKPDQITQKLYKKSIEKLHYHSAPSGTLVCNEQVRGKKGNADRAYEFCTIVEQFTSLQSAVAKWGEEKNISWAEKIFFNPGHGNRLSDFSALTYLGSDNRYETREGHGDRYLYSARHSAAACCALNGGRLVPIFIRGMWMENSEDQLPTALFFGPSELNLDFKGTKVIIEQDTIFPFEDTIKFYLKTPAPKGFAFYIRKPSWLQGSNIEVINGSYELMRNFWKVLPEEGKNTRVNVIFTPKMEFMPLKRRRFALRRGTLLYPLKIPAEFREYENLQDSGFFTFQTDIFPTTLKYYKRKNIYLKTSKDINVVMKPWNKTTSIWEDPPIKILIGGKDPLELIPFGSTILRKLSFKVKGAENLK